jgi:hypothetical protein
VVVALQHLEYARFHEANNSATGLWQPCRKWSYSYPKQAHQRNALIVFEPFAQGLFSTWTKLYSDLNASFLWMFAQRLNVLTLISSLDALQCLAPC